MALSRDDIALWVNAMFEEGASGKTIANKQRFLSGALNAAVVAGHIAWNPCHGLRLPRWERREMVFLTESEFAALLNAITPFWRPFVDFLVASGVRWREATALRPGDVDVAQGTLRISRAWKVTNDDLKLVLPKSSRSVRTINVAEVVLAKLDYFGEWLFQNRVGDFVRAQGFTRRVWASAVKRAGLAKTPRIHDPRQVPPVLLRLSQPHGPADWRRVCPQPRRNAGAHSDLALGRVVDTRRPGKSARFVVSATRSFSQRRHRCSPWADPRLRLRSCWCDQSAASTARSSAARQPRPGR